MFATRLDSLIKRYPLEAKALERLAHYFRSMEERDSSSICKVKLDAGRIFEISNAGSLGRLNALLNILISSELFERYLLVRSPGGGGIAEFSSYSDLPNVIHDSNTDLELPVTPDNVVPMYRPIVEGTGAGRATGE